MSTVEEIKLPGNKLLLEQGNDIHAIDKVGRELYEQNRSFIKAKIKDNWFVIIDPFDGVLIASLDMQELYNYSREKYPSKLFYFVGLLRNNFVKL